MKRLRTDNGLEFCLDKFNSFCQTEGIVRHLTVPGTPQQNGVAEHMNRTLMEKVRCLLSNSGLPKSFWAEAAVTACFLVNRSPSTAIDKKTPEEVWSSSPPNYSDLRIFGCPAYAHVDNGKLEPRSRKCIFLGYMSGVKSYKLWCPELSKIIVSCNVIFDETPILCNQSPRDKCNESVHQQDTDIKVEFPFREESTLKATSDEGTEMIEVEEATTPQYSITRDRPRRPIKPPQRFAEADMVAYALNVAEDIDAGEEPSTYK